MIDYRQIVWLASYPKSGNTWVRCFLDAYLLGDVDINNIISSVGDDIAARCLPGDGSDPSKMPVQIQVLVRGMGLVRLLHQYDKSKLPGVPLFVKTHNTHALCNGVELLPEGVTKSVIHIVRDPRDTLVSFSKHVGKSMDESIDVFFDKIRVLTDKRNPKMFDFISSWCKNTSSYVNADSHNIMTIRYEDLKNDPHKEFVRILTHSGMEVDHSRVDKAIEAVKLSKLRDKEKKHGFKESSPFARNAFFGEGKTGGWKDHLTEAQLFRIEKNCASMMKRLGYEFSTRAVA